MSRKMLLILLFSLSALILSSAATSMVGGLGSSFRLDVGNKSCLEASSSVKLCGDPIDTPVYPASISSIG
jgi:hypothetical protein